MSQKRDGGPAFPGQMQRSTNVDISEGMSLRDWFAGQALQGIVTIWEVFYEVGGGHPWPLSSPEKLRLAAQLACQLADAMLDAREVKT